MAQRWGGTWVKLKSLYYQFPGDPNLIPPFSKVDLADPVGVDGVPLVRVDDNTEETRVSVDELGLEPNFQIVEDRGIIQESQVSHVFALLKFRRIDLSNLGGLESFFL